MSERPDPRLSMDLPAPARRVTPADIGLVLGVALLVSVGLVIASFGNGLGFVFSAVAALGVVTVRASRFARLNEPVVEPFTGTLAVAVSALVMVLTFILWQSAPVGGLPLAVTLAGLLGLYATFVFLLLRKRKGGAWKK